MRQQQSDRADNRGNGSSIDRTDTASVSAADIGTVQQDSGILFDSWEQHCKKHGFNIRTSDASGFKRSDHTDVKAVLNGNAQGGNRQDGLDRVFNQGQIIVAIYISKSAIKYHMAIYLFRILTSCKPA